MIPVEFVVAIDADGGIGKNGDVPWYIPEDLKRFATITKGGKGVDTAVLMGRKTWESIPDKYKPLKGRLNIVLTRQEGYSVGSGTVTTASSFEEALKRASGYDVLFAVGGAAIYDWALKVARRGHVTHVRGNYNCDAHFPIHQAQMSFWGPVETTEWSSVPTGDGEGVVEWRYEDWERRIDSLPIGMEESASAQGEYPEIKVLKIGQHACIPYSRGFQCLRCRSVYPADHMEQVPCPFRPL